MSKGDKPMKLDFDLDGHGGLEEKVVDPETPSIEEGRTSLEEARKWEALMLPIKITDGDGNFKFQMKTLETVSIDEFKSWMREVLPLGDETIEKFMGLSKKADDKNGYNNLKIRREIFNAVIKMHEMRWVFGLGKDKLPKDLGSN